MQWYNFLEGQDPKALSKKSDAQHTGDKIDQYLNGTTNSICTMKAIKMGNFWKQSSSQFMKNLGLVISRARLLGNQQVSQLRS